jgi:O-antigen/teichoic acid export membrane protein
VKLVSALSFILRGGSAGAKFLFVLYLSGKSSSALLGQVAVLMTIAAVFAQVAGMEINQVIGRQLHALNGDERLRLLRRQAQAALVAYLVLAPATVLLYADLLGSYWFSACGVLVLEHFIIEVYRFRILMLHTVYASSLLFIKNAGWVLVLVGLVEAGAATPSLALVLHCWFGVLALTAAPLLLTRHAWLTLKEFLAPRVWLGQSGSLLWRARTFLVSAVAVSGVGALDKLLIAGKFPAADLGVYFFFATCASIISLTVSFSIGATVGPQSIKIHASLGRDAYLPHLRRLKRLYLLTTVATMVAILLPADFLLTHFGKTEYSRQLDILYLLLPSAALIVLCEPYKVNAYLERQDLILVGGNLFHLLSLALCVTLFAIKRDIVWISAGVLLSSLLSYLYFALGLGNRVFYHRRFTRSSAEASLKSRP